MVLLKSQKMERTSRPGIARLTVRKFLQFVYMIIEKDARQAHWIAHLLKKALYKISAAVQAPPVRG